MKGTKKGGVICIKVAGPVSGIRYLVVSGGERPILPCIKVAGPGVWYPEENV